MKGECLIYFNIDLKKKFLLKVSLKAHLNFLIKPFNLPLVLGKEQTLVCCCMS